MQDIGKLEDEWTMAKFAARYESEVPEDWPRCESCNEPLDDSEMQHTGDNKLCNNCGTVCGCCDEKAWKEDIEEGKPHHKDIESICTQCVEDVFPEDISPFHGSPATKRYEIYVTHKEVTTSCLIIEASSPEQATEIAQAWPCEQVQDLAITQVYNGCVVESDETIVTDPKEVGENK